MCLCCGRSRYRSCDHGEHQRLSAESVRFHLGLCLLWLGSVDKAKSELRLARAAGAKTTLGVEAQRFLQSLSGVGTG